MLLVCLFLLALNVPLGAVDYPLGYHFVDGQAATVIKFTKIKNLIIVPAQLNDTIKLNLILDTGIRNLILFSQKASKLTNLSKGRKLKLGGRGVLESVECDFSFPNEIRLGDVIGRGIGAAVVRNNELVEAAPGVDGIIGYELFVRFCIQIDYLAQTLTLFDQVPRDARHDFNSVDLTIRNQRPEIALTLQLSKHKKIDIKALIDTGSSFELLVYDKDRDKYVLHGSESRIGTGLAGTVIGYWLGTMPFHVGDDNRFTADSNLVITSGKRPDQTTASIGGGFLKNYVVMFDYPHSRFYIKRGVKEKG